MLKRWISTALALCLLLAALPAFAADATPEPTEPPAPVSFGKFSAENLRAAEDAEDPMITEAIFAEAELTLVNFWATWCPSCRVELPDLAQIAELSEGRFQVLGVLTDSVLDYDGTRDNLAIEDAQALLDDAESTYPVVVPDMWLMQLMSIVTSIPTTFLVDSEGFVVTGVVGRHTAAEWLAIAEEALAYAAQ